MIDCSRNSTLLFAFPAILLVLLAPDLAAAQAGSSAPIRIAPPSAQATGTPAIIIDRAPAASAPSGAPVAIAPADGSTTGAPPDAGSSAAPGATPGDVRIDVEPLAPVSADAAGVRFEGDPVFTDRMWMGTDAATARALVTALPDEISSAPLNALARRLLSSSATPPQDGSVAASTSEGSLIGHRLKKLIALGDPAWVQALLRQIPGAARDPLLVEVAQELAWIEADTDAACGRVRERILTDQAEFWQKNQIVCQILGNEDEQAALAVQLAKDQGIKDDAFFALVDQALAGREVTLPSDARFEPYELPLLLRATRALPPDAAQRLPAALARALATASGVPQATRLAAAERAARLNALSAEDLGAVYAAVTPSETELGDLSAVARGRNDARARALALRGARAAFGAVAQSEAARAALAAAEPAGLYAEVAVILEPVIAGLKPLPPIGETSGDLARALYAASAESESIRAPALGAAPIAAGADAVHARIWALDLLANGVAGTPLDTGQLALWHIQDATRNPTGAADRARLLLASLDGLGLKAPAETWTLLAGSSAPVSPSAGAAEMMIAANGGRVAETVARAITLAAGTPSEAAHAAQARDIIAALSRIGLGQAARRYAVEGAIAAGL